MMGRLLALLRERPSLWGPLRMLLSAVIPHVRGRASGETVEKTGVRVNKPSVFAQHEHYFR